MGSRETSADGMSALWRGSGAEFGLRGLELVEHPGGVELVPGFDDLAIFPAAEDDGAGREAAAGGGQADAVAGVGAGEGQADGAAVALGDDVADLDFNVGEGGEEGAAKIEELVDALDGLAVFAQAVADEVGGGEAGDGGFVALVPDEFKPFVGEFMEVLGHGDRVTRGRRQEKLFRVGFSAWGVSRAWRIYTCDAVTRHLN